MLKVVHDETEADATTAPAASSSLQDEIVRENGELVERPDESGDEAQVA